MNKLIGDSDHITEIKKFIHLAASNDYPVLIEGETGTGKDLIANAIHSESARSKHSFLHINCASLPATLVESELFGFTRGSFTGAVDNRAGIFEDANKGTLYLDEIESMDHKFQSDILHVIETNKFRKIGSTRPIDIDVRIISASNEDLGRLVSSRRFRKDLLFRLNVMYFKVKPLRERKEDIYPLADYYLRHYSSLSGKHDVKFSRESISMLEQYDWPGNVRELVNLTKRLAVYISDDVIEPDHIYPLMYDLGRITSYSCDDKMTITELAKILGISRKTLWLKKKQLMPEPESSQDT